MVVTARTVDLRGMAMLLLLTSPHALCEPLGAGARPAHPIRVISLQGIATVAFGGKQTSTGGQSQPIRRE